MRRAVHFLVVWVMAMTLVTPTAAQQRLFAAGPSGIVELDPRQGSEGTVIRRFVSGALSDDGIAAAADDGKSSPSGEITSMAGGAFLVWPSGGALALLNTRSGTLQHVAFPDFLPQRIVGTDGNLRVLVVGTTHSTQRRVLLVADARSGNVRVVDLGSTLLTGPLAYAAATDLLFIARPRQVTAFGGFDFLDVDVMQVETGAVLKTLAISPANASALEVNATGTRLFVSSYPGGIYAFDTVSGAVVARSLDDRAWRAPIIDDARNRLLFTTAEGLEAFSMDTLQAIGRANAPRLRIPDPPGIESPRLKADVDVSPVSATIFAFEGGYVNYNYYPGTCQQASLVAMNAANGEVRTVVDLLARGVRDCFMTLVRITEPLPPAGLAANVLDRRVTLTWHAPVGATRYEVEAGLASGQGALVLSANDRQLAVDNVPPGTYYVRVRAINTIGKSAPSQEVRLVVE